MGNGLCIRILTPLGEGAPVACDSVTLFAMDNERGEGGGSVGIRRGHIPAVIALEPGSAVRARLNGAEVFSMTVPGGFAFVKDDTVTVLMSDAPEEN